MSTQGENEVAHRALRDASAMRKRIAALKEEALVAEICTAGVVDPLWTKVLAPKLDKLMVDFQERDVWSCEESDFGKIRERARTARALRDYVLTSVGKRDSYLKEAEDLGSKLEKAVKEGRIPPIHEE